MTLETLTETDKQAIKIMTERWVSRKELKKLYKCTTNKLDGIIYRLGMLYLIAEDDNTGKMNTFFKIITDKDYQEWRK